MRVTDASLRESYLRVTRAQQQALARTQLQVTSGQRVASFRVTVDVAIGEFQVGPCGRQLGQIILGGAAMRAAIADEYDERARGCDLFRGVAPRLVLGHPGRAAQKEEKTERQS